MNRVLGCSSCILFAITQTGTLYGFAPTSDRGSIPLVSQVLAKPWLDRTIAFVATVPFLYLAYSRYQHIALGIPLAPFVIATLIMFVTMIVRRPPKRPLFQAQPAKSRPLPPGQRSVSLA